MAVEPASAAAGVGRPPGEALPSEISSVFRLRLLMPSSGERSRWARSSSSASWSRPLRPCPSRRHVQLGTWPSSRQAMMTRMRQPHAGLGDWWGRAWSLRRQVHGGRLAEGVIALKIRHVGQHSRRWPRQGRPASVARSKSARISLRQACLLDFGDQRVAAVAVRVAKRLGEALGVHRQRARPRRCRRGWSWPFGRRSSRCLVVQDVVSHW